MNTMPSTVLLTGASGGIGEAIAHRLAAAGTRMLLVGRSREALAAVAARLPVVDMPHVVIVADVTSPTGRTAIVDALRRLGRPLDALVNAAGVNRFALLPDCTAADITSQVDTNVTAPILLTQLVLPFLDRRRGRILNIGSSFGSIGYPGFAAYCASKFALRGFTEALRRELADTAVQVACLSPRATRTRLNSESVCAMNAALGNATDPPERVAAVAGQMLAARRMRDRAIGWPERFFMRLNAVLPSLVDGALRRQLATIKRFATAAAAPPKESPMRSIASLVLFLAASAFAPGAARAGEADDIAHLQTRWAEVNYQMTGDAREHAFATLVGEAEGLTQAHPDAAPYLVWEGIIRATYAGVKGGIGALGECKKARALFERSIKLDPAALMGSAYTSLGSLYYQVPGWPLGFGDDDKAREMLAKGLEFNPDGIDANYFQGDFLLDEGQYDEALAAFEKALRAPPRPGRESADAGRRAEVMEKIAETRRRM